MQALEKMHQIVGDRHKYAQDWKARTGGKVMAYLCTYAPEELMYAAGILPVRVLGTHEIQDITEPHLYAMYCPLCRDALAQGLLGRYDYIDGIMIAQSCLHIRQTYSSWVAHTSIPYHYYLFCPHQVQNRRAKGYLAQELAEFKKSLEEFTGKEISNEDLDRAIEIYNTNRRLMHQVYEFRKAEEPLITGLEAMEMVVSSQYSDKEEHNQILKQLLEELPQRKMEREVGSRLMTIGSENSEYEFTEMVESVGGTIVIEEQCTGSRYFWNEVIPEEDRLQAIANRYIDRPPCPSKDWPERWRFPHILKLVKDYNVEGVLLCQQKFCDPHELDIPPIKELLDENGIPSYFLEFDVFTPVGQFSTRVEAFLEMLQLELV